MAMPFNTEGSEETNAENIRFWKNAFDALIKFGGVQYDRFVGKPLESASRIGEGLLGNTSGYQVDEINTPSIVQQKIVEDSFEAVGATAIPGAFSRGVGSTTIGALGGAGKKEGAKYAGSVNLYRQTIDESAKKLETTLFEQHGIKTKITQEEMSAKAHEVLQRFRDEPDYFKERIAAYQKGEKPSIEEELAHRIINASNFQNFTDIAKKVADNELPREVMDKMLDSIKGHFLSITQPMASEAGRRLNMYNIEVGRSRALDAISKLDKGLNERQLSDLVKVDWNDAHSVNQFVKRLPDPKFKEYFYEYWYNSILSGIPTHVVNVASNTLWGMWQVPHRALTGALDASISAFTGKARNVFMDEVLPLISGEIKGVPKAATRAWDVLRHNRLMNIEDKWAREMDFAMGAFERSPSEAVRAIGVPLTVPTRALRAMDVAANSIAYDGQMQALAKRAYHQAGNKGSFEKFEKEFLSNPPLWAKDEALKFAKYSTFTDDPGAISQWVAEGRDVIPGGRLIVPFVNTIGNIMKRGVEMTPGLGLALSKNQLPAEVAAKQIEGAIITLALMRKIQNGEIIGAPPENTQEREAFYREKRLPWSIKVGDTYYQYRRIEPFNMPLSIAATAYDKIKNAKDESTATDIFLDVAVNVKDHLIDSGYLQGVQNFLDTKRSNIKTMPQRFASSLVPYSGFWRSINRAYEAYSEGEAKVYDHRDWLSSFAQVIPTLYKLRKPELNVWGEEIVLPGNAFRQWLPYKWSEQTYDPVEMFLEDLSDNLEKSGERGVYPGLPDQWIKHKGTKIRIDDDLYRQYAIDYGVNAKKRLYEKITGPTVLAEKLSTDPKFVKSKIENILDKERERALKRLKKNMGLIGSSSMQEGEEE